MNNKLPPVIALGVGIGIGVLAAKQYLKDKYEKMTQEEIDSVKKAFSKKKKEDADKAAAEEADEEKQYKEVLKENKYGGESDTKKPYVISPDEFGEHDNYDIITLIYYADKVLADENDVPLSDIDAIVGLDSLLHFGEYEDDSVYVRNEGLECEYEILLDNRKWSDITK